jgi:hypothetical protein
MNVKKSFTQYLRDLIRTRGALRVGSVDQPPQESLQSEVFGAPGRSSLRTNGLGRAGMSVSHSGRCLSDDTLGKDMVNFLSEIHCCSLALLALYAPFESQKLAQDWHF